MKNSISYIVMKAPGANKCEKCNPFDRCFEFCHEQRPLILCADKKSSTRYVYENRKSDHVTKYRVDGELITDNGAKCDFLLLNCEQEKAFFIELKGSDLIRAIEQIDRTIDLLKDTLGGFAFHARIVLTRVNTTDLLNSKYLKLKKKVERFNGDLEKKSRQMTEIN